jgi:hypothetical protein
MIRIEVAADSIRFIRNIAAGSIDFATVSNNGFEALADYGNLVVQVTNIDSLSGGYTLSAINCTFGVIIQP